MNITSTGRRLFLKAGAASLALPALESFAAPESSRSAKAQNIVCIGTNLGFHPPAFFPKQTGRDFELPTLLKPIADHRDSFTVFSGLDHRTVGSGHGAWSTFLCGVDPVGYSLDQIVADQLGQDSRFPSIQLTAGQAVANMSHTRQGVPLPMIQRPSVLFSKLFASAKDRARNEYLLRSGYSTLDAVLEDAKRNLNQFFG